MRFLLPALVVLVTLSGCSNKALLEQQQSELDTLREDLNAAYAENDRLKAENASLDRQLREALDVEIVESSNGERGETVAIIPTDVLFESGSAALTPQGIARMAEIAADLRAAYGGREIRIEGYTDNKQIGPHLQDKYPSNWELSAARAGMVARHLQWTHDFDGTNMEIVGLSQYHPTADNATAEGRTQNRRVRIAVMGG